MIAVFTLKRVVPIKPPRKPANEKQNGHHDRKGEILRENLRETGENLSLSAINRCKAPPSGIPLLKHGYGQRLRGTS